MRAVVLALILIAGCGRLGFDEGGADGPKRIAELSSDSRDQDPALTADQLLIVFGSDRPGGSGGTDLWEARRANVTDEFGTPRPVSELNGSDEDITAHLSADGLTIWYASRRPGVNNVSILVATRTSRDDRWDAPVLAAPKIDTGAGEFSPSLFAGDSRMLYASDRDELGGGGDIFETAFIDGDWRVPVNRDDLNTKRADGAPAVFADGLAVVFVRESGQLADLFLAERSSIDDPWGAAVPLSLNSDARDSGPWMSADGSSIYFDSDRDGTVDLYQSRRTAGEL